MSSVIVMSFVMDSQYVNVRDIHISMQSWGGASKPKHEMVQEYWAEEGMGMGMMPKNYISISVYVREDSVEPELQFYRTIST